MTPPIDADHETKAEASQSLAAVELSDYVDFMEQALSSLSDDRLVALLRSGGQRREDAFREIYFRYSGRIYGYCKKILGTEDYASDALQETFYRFLQRVDTETDFSNVPAFLLRIARNYCFDCKKKYTPPVAPDDFEIAVEDTPIESRELTGMVTAALELLPDDHKEAVLLQTYGELSYQEISDLTNVPVSTVRNRIARGKKKIRDILAPYLTDYFS